MHSNHTALRGFNRQTIDVFALQNFEFPNLQVSKFTNLQAMQFRQESWLAQ